MLALKKSEGSAPFLQRIINLSMAMLAATSLTEAADHGPVFGLGTPTNPKGCWSVVSLNKSLATIKFKPGNTVSVPQLWQLIHSKGYTPKETVVSARGAILSVQESLKLKVSGTNDVIALIEDPQNLAVYLTAASKAGATVILEGVMTPGKDLKVAGPLQIKAVK